MSDWRNELGKFIESRIGDLHDVIGKYLELIGNPDKVPLDDIVTVVQMSGIFNSSADQDFLIQVAGEFLVYAGYSPVPVDDQYFKKL